MRLYSEIDLDHKFSFLPRPQKNHAINICKSIAEEYSQVIEKMKCCGNCKHYADCEGYPIRSLTQEQIDGSMMDCDKWELAE